ncbi:MAG: 2-oxoacid:acceptor oxidoreductase subunit alpha [Deltaproteobacteria bacterium]|nr:2-oxoacid:acceptor oxidoreductase subunit alpha [Deltaproteobacteria bacterium]
MSAPIINDFSIRVATANGTGSQSSNTILFKSLFRMGIGVCAKNLFPSNIQGLPTWFQIRVSPKGYQNLREEDDIVVLMNPETAHEDLARVHAGASVFYNADLIRFNKEELKSGTVLYALPVEELAKKIVDAKLRTLLKNVIYVGALAALYKIDKETLVSVIQDQFKNKAAAVSANLHALELGIEFASENLKKADKYEFKKGTVNTDKIIIDGNTACALGAIYGGCTVVAWYPITPSSSLAETMESYLAQFRTDSDGKAKYAIVQAEDELASIGMVIGAGWAGVRAMTATSGPGISLMNEFIGLAYYAEVPAVIVDVQRVGPSTGLPTRTQQGDILECAQASHGDTKHVLLFPSSPGESFEMMQAAFDLADRLQTVVFVMSDLDLGMNSWVDQELNYSEKKFDRGKVLGEKQLDQVKQFGRYLDVDKDSICYRTLPGTNHIKGAYFLRGTGHDEFSRYTESPEMFMKNMERLLNKWHSAKRFVPEPILSGQPKSKVGMIAYGTTHHAVAEVLDRVKSTPLKYLRVRAYPFTADVEDFVRSCDRVFVVEQNRDGQLRQLLEIDIPGHQQKFRSIKCYGGFPISADFVQRELEKELGTR